MSLKFSPAEAREWADKGFTPGEAVHWFRRGLTPATARAQITAIEEKREAKLAAKLAEEKAWADEGFTPKQADAWRAVIKIPPWQEDEEDYDAN